MASQLARGMTPKDTKSLANHEIVVVAVYLCGGATKPADSEDVAMKANELAPGRFTWTKYKDQISLEHVRVYLSDAKKEKNGSYGIVDELMRYPADEGGVLAHGWLEDRRFWIGYRLSDAAIDAAMVGLPRAAAVVLPTGVYQLATEMNMGGSILVAETRITGFRNVLSSAGAESGDCMLLKFEPTRRRVEVTVGDESLVEEAQDRDD